MESFRSWFLLEIQHCGPKKILSSVQCRGYEDYAILVSSIQGPAGDRISDIDAMCALFRGSVVEIGMASKENDKKIR